jgi:transcriptional regulator of arginine metabolism
MHMPEPLTAREERHRLIVSAVTRRSIGSQHELLAALAEAGCVVTQATISRDVNALGLEKQVDALGRPRYAMPDSGRRTDPRVALASLLRQHGRRARGAQNIVVLHSELGTAPAIARALDRVRHELVVGTLAGDDTCLVVTSDRKAAASLAAELQAMIAG